MHATSVSASTRVSTGIPELDTILGGGLTGNRSYLLEGTPGSGKTTIALQFLLEGVRAGEPGLYITLSETAAELREVGRSHGWTLDGIELFELVSEDGLHPESEQSILDPSEVELGRDHRRRHGMRRSPEADAGWCSTVCRRCGCWPRTPCATGGKSWP
jgi:circadian clock protein KaiC